MLLERVTLKVVEKKHNFVDKSGTMPLYIPTSLELIKQSIHLSFDKNIVERKFYLKPKLEK